MKQVQYNEYLVSTVETEGLVLQHQGISAHNAEHAPTCFHLFKGQCTWLSFDNSVWFLWHAAIVNIKFIDILVFKHRPMKQIDLSIYQAKK